MVTDQTRNTIWQGLSDMARLARYYETLADRHRRKHFWIRVVLFAAAASGIAALLDLFPEVVQIVAGGLVALCVAWDFASDYAKKPQSCTQSALNAAPLRSNGKTLWGDLDDIDDTEARQRNTRLSRRLIEVTRWAGHTDIQEDPKLNEKCEVAAYRGIQDQYGV